MSALTGLICRIAGARHAWSDCCAQLVLMTALAGVVRDALGADFRDVGDEAA